MPLTKYDAEQLLDQIYATAELLGTEIKSSAATMMVRDMRQYEMPEIEQALARCRSELTGRLTLAAVLERMPSSNQFLSPNEAWSLALQAQDEYDTIVWPTEAAVAAGVAQPILDQGDKVGARMAFIAAYEREVGKTKAEGRRPAYQVSLGHSPERRQDAITQGIKDGRLDAPNVKHLLPAPHGFRLGHDGDEEITEEEREKRRQNIEALRALLKSKSNSRAEKREEEERRRQELIRQAEEAGKTEDGES